MSSEILVHWLESFGSLDLFAASALATVFVVAAFMPVPRTILVIGAGAAFGLRSVVVIVPSTTIGCILAFLLARTLLKGWVERQIVKRPGWKVVAQAVDDEGWRIVALMRFWGPLPNSAQNYLFGLTNIGWWPYALTTLVFTLPQIMFYTYLGTSGRAMILNDGVSSQSMWPIALAMLTMIAIFILISRRVRVLLAQKLDPQNRQG